MTEKKTEITPENSKQKATSEKGADGATKLRAVSPRTKLPVEHPESQEVERIHYQRQTSLCGHPLNEADIDGLMDQAKKK